MVRPTRAYLSGMLMERMRNPAPTGFTGVFWGCRTCCVAHWCDSCTPAFTASFTLKELQLFDIFGPGRD